MKIYHYTTIETLALILENKTLRFNNARHVDDLVEAITEDYGSMQDYVFISCWSKNEIESIPLWKIYGGNGHGVRLESDTRYINFEGTETPINGIYKIVTNVKKQHDNHYFINVWQNRESINPYFITNYSDENRIFKKDTSTATQKSWEFQIDSTFNTKGTEWSFEDEVRFILLGCDLEVNESKDNWQLVFNKITSKKQFTADFVDLVITDNFLDNLTITLGPLQSTAESLIVESLISKYNPKIKLKKSELLLRK